MRRLVPALAIAVAVPLLPAVVPAAHAAPALPAPKPARRLIPHPQPSASPARVAVRRLDLGRWTSTRGWAREEDTSTDTTGGTTTDIGAVSAASSAPEQVYSTVREGDFHTVAQGLLPSSPYTLRLHLAEGWWTQPGQRRFDVTANGTTALAGVDIVARAGGSHRALTLDVAVRTDGQGRLDLGFVGRVDQPSVAGWELLWDQPAKARAVFPSWRTTRVMALGDSITLGYGDDAEGGYRFPLWDALAATGRDLTPVGPNTNPPYWSSSRWQGSGWAGWNGWTIDDVLGSPTAALNTTGTAVDDWLRGHQPDVVLVHLGNNDLDAGEPPTRARDELAELLDRITTARPDADVVVARVLNVQGAPQSWITAYNDLISDVVMRAAVDRHVHLVDMETVVDDPGLYSDGVHPDTAGYHRMAQAWLAALEAQDAR